MPSSWKLGTLPRLPAAATCDREELGWVTAWVRHLSSNLQHEWMDGTRSITEWVWIHKGTHNCSWMCGQRQIQAWFLTEKCLCQELGMTTLCDEKRLSDEFGGTWTNLLKLLVTFIKTDTLPRQTPAWGWAVEAEARGSSGKPETPLGMRGGEM